MTRAMVLCVLVAGCTVPEPAAVDAPPLARVATWGIQLQGLDREGAVDAVAAADLDLVVLDPTHTVRGLEGFPIADLVARVRARGGLCLAYLNVGQAEDYRTYWPPYWKAPAEGARGVPDYLLALDPEGWEGNYPVAYWDARWRTVLWGHDRAPLDRLLAAGFDGVYLDWVLGYEFGAVAAAAESAGVDPAVEMAALVRDLREYARKRKPGFLVVAQNCSGLPERVPEFRKWIDGVAQEDLSFRGAAGAEWDDEASGDTPTPAGARDTLAAKLKTIGRPVLTLDYAQDPAHTAAAIAFSREHGFVPCVSRTPLDRLE